MGKKWTDEERAAFGLKMKKIRDEKRATEVVAEQLDIEKEVAKKENKVETFEATKPQEPQEPQETQEPQTTIGDMNTEQLLRHALEAIANLTSQNQGGQSQQGVGIQNGKLTGTVEKYIMDPAHYPDPTERLSDEPRLSRFGFKDNYELKWDVSQSTYTTLDNIRTTEPKFSLDLIRVVYDEETGEKTNGRYTEYRIVLHEDPESALVVARENGVDVDSMDEATFLNEMRYLQIRDWLFGLPNFYPQRPQALNNSRQQVIDGKLVDFFEVNEEEGKSVSLPFTKLDNKL